MDLYGDAIMKGKATDEKLKKVNSISMIVLVVLMVVLAIKPPALIGVINNFSIAGSAAAFFVPLLFGTWWKRANVTGCILSMIGGIGYYMLSTVVPAMTLGVNPIIPSLVVASVAMVVGSLMTAPPSKEIVDIWFGVGKYVHKKA